MKPKTVFLVLRHVNVLCLVEKSRKVPTIEQVFTIDQRTTRKMGITSIEISTTKKLQKK